ncbi:TPA: GDP-mannose 4,6-dehydratase [Candidatus Nomurabacteria bacterium]|nr:GDP-mannose 4,6-dehydratase [Candidatus Nomurabacteria bacterium]
MKTAVITGITGQDSSYMAELLLGKNYKVIGVVRRSSTINTININSILNDIELVYGDLSDSSSISGIIEKYKPDEFYNLGAMSFVPTSWKAPEYTADIDGIGPLRCLEAIKRIKPDTRFYQATSSECFGKVQETPQTEKTPFYPKSPYSVSKLFGHWITVNYRESYDLFGVSGILFNHTSPRRSIEFVTRKISNGVARIKWGLDKDIHLGNIDSKRDIGFAKEYVNAIWLMLQKDKPDTYCIGSEETHPIREICDIAFSYVGLNYTDYVVIDPKFYRPTETDTLLSDCTKAHKILGWYPETTFKQLVEMMVENDLKLVKDEL